MSLRVTTTFRVIEGGSEEPKDPKDPSSKAPSANLRLLPQAPNNHQPKRSSSRPPPEPLLVNDLDGGDLPPNPMVIEVNGRTYYAYRGEDGCLVVIHPPRYDGGKLQSLDFGHSRVEVYYRGQACEASLQLNRAMGRYEVLLENGKKVLCSFSPPPRGRAPGEMHEWRKVQWKIEPGGAVAESGPYKPWEGLRFVLTDDGGRVRRFAAPGGLSVYTYHDGSVFLGGAFDLGDRVFPLTQAPSSFREPSLCLPSHPGLGNEEMIVFELEQDSVVLHHHGLEECDRVLLNRNELPLSLRANPQGYLNHQAARGPRVLKDRFQQALQNANPSRQIEAIRLLKSAQTDLNIDETDRLIKALEAGKPIKRSQILDMPSENLALRLMGDEKGFTSLPSSSSYEEGRLFGKTGSIFAGALARTWVQEGSFTSVGFFKNLCHDTAIVEGSELMEQALLQFFGFSKIKGLVGLATRLLTSGLSSYGASEMMGEEESLHNAMTTAFTHGALGFSLEAIARLCFEKPGFWVGAVGSLITMGAPLVLNHALEKPIGESGVG